jgi:cell wall-associated NlpC family hydrolase
MNINRYIGIPYADKGRGWDSCDCFGLLQLWMKTERGIDLPDYLEVYTSSSDRDSVAGAIEENKVGWTPVEDPQFGDALLFNILGAPMHVGIKLDGHDFLHAFQNCDSCIERLDGVAWTRRLVGAYRWVT